MRKRAAVSFAAATAVKTSQVSLKRNENPRSLSWPAWPGVCRFFRLASSHFSCAYTVTAFCYLGSLSLADDQRFIQLPYPSLPLPSSAPNRGSTYYKALACLPNMPTPKVIFSLTLIQFFFSFLISSYFNTLFLSLNLPFCFSLSVKFIRGSLSTIVFPVLSLRTPL
jgi:hypothetical protein